MPALLLALAVTVQVSAVDPWWFGTMKPSYVPPPTCSNPGAYLPNTFSFPVGCVDIVSGEPIRCWATFGVFMDYEGLDADGRLVRNGYHDHDYQRLNSDLRHTLGTLWSDLPDQPSPEPGAEVTGSTGDQIWIGVYEAPSASGGIRLHGEYTVLEPGYSFLPNSMWHCDPDTAQTIELEGLITVKAGDFAELPPSPWYVRCGSTSQCAGTDNVFPGHPQSFYGRADLVVRIQRLAIGFRALNPTLKVRFTDMSLPHGGLFDINQTWEAPHARHHNGRSVDIARELWDTENGREVWMGTDTSYFELLNMLAERLDLHRIVETRQRIHYDLPVRTNASGYDILAPSRVCHPDDAYPGGRR